VLYAQKGQNPSFTNLTTVDNLSQNSVSHILQDSQGMIWLATNAGLDKHIGNEILHVEGFPKSLVENITYLHDPGEDFIFICTDTTNYRIHKWYNRSAEIKPEPLGNELTNILYLHKIEGKKYLVFTNNCIAEADGALKNVEKKACKDTIRSVVAYNDSTFFLGTQKGLFQYNLPKNKLAPIFEGKSTKALFIHKKVIGKKDSIAYLYAATQKKPPAVGATIIRYRIRSNGELTDLTNLGSLHSPVSSLYAGEDGRLWVGTKNEGLYVFDEKGRPQLGDPEAHYCIQSNMGGARMLFSSNEINTLYASKDGVVWAGTEGGGVNLFQQKKQAFKSSYTKEAFTTFYKNKAPARTETYNNNVWSIYPYPQGSGNTVLIGTEGNGVVYFDLARDSILKNILLPPKDDPKVDDAKTVQKIRPGFNQDLILGTNAGLYRLTLNNGNLPDHYKPIKDFRKKTGKVSLLEYSPKHGSWLAGKKGGDKIHVLDKSVENYRTSIAVPNNEELSFIQPLDTFTLVGTTHGLYKINSLGNALLPFPDDTTKIEDMHYICAYQDKKSGKIWLGTDKKGLYYYTDQGGIEKVPRFDKPEVIYDIHLDNQNHLWFSTNHGIYEYIEQPGIFNQYGIPDGIQVHEYNGGATTILGPGYDTIAFGGINGICHFNPNSATTLSNSTAFKPVIRWRYPSDQDALRDKSYHEEYVNYNDTSKVKINVNYKFAYIDITPMLGDYQNPINNDFIVIMNGDTLAALNGTYIIPENKFNSTLKQQLFAIASLLNPNPKIIFPQNLVSIKYRSGNSTWLPNGKEQIIQLVVHRQFFVEENWLWVVLFAMGIIALFLLYRYIKGWGKIRVVQEKISEISRLEGTEAICQTAIQHLIKSLKFDYAVISLVDFDKKTINSRYGASNKKQIPDPSLWMSESSYALSHPDILAQTTRIQKSITVAREKVIAVGDENSSIFTANEEKNLFNSEIMKAHGHDKLVRIFVPIIHRSSSSGYSGTDNNKDDDIALGVVEVGYFYDRYSRLLRWLQAISSFSFQSDVLKYLEREKIRLQLYVDNLTHPYFRIYIKEQKKDMHDFVEKLEKKSDLEHRDHVGFLQLVLKEMADKIGAKYGDVSLVSYNTDEIDFMHETLTHGYTHEAVKENNKRFEKENEGKEGIINYLAKSYNEENGQIGNRLPYYYTGDVDKDKKYIKFLEDGCSEMVLPMVVNDDANLVGVVNFISTDRDYFNRVLATIYAKGVKKATDIYLQKKQYNALKAIVLPFDTFTQTEESIYRSMVESLKQYFLSDYISVWTRSSFEDKKFVLSKATMSDFYRRYVDFDFTQAKIKKDDGAGNPAEIIHVDSIENKERRRYKFVTQPDLAFKSYIILRISIDDKYQAFINVFSRRRINDDEISGYSKAFLDEITKKVGFATQSNRLLNSVERISKSLAEREFSSPEKMIVEQAHKLLPSVDSVVLFPYTYGRDIRLGDAIVGGAELPMEDQQDTSKPAYIANLILKKETQWIETEQQYLDLAYEALPNRPHQGTFWHEKLLQSVAAIKLDHEGEPLGVMFFNYKVPKKFKEDNSMIFINAFTNFAKVALLNEDFIKRMQAERTRIERENNRLTDIQRSLKNEKEAIQIENKELSEKMAEMLPRAARTSHFQILQGVNHDVRNYLLKMEDIISKIGKHVSSNNRSDFDEMVKGLDDNIDNINNLLKLFDFQESTVKESIDIREVIKQVIRFFDQSNKWIKFHLKFGEDIPMITCNKAEFSMIIYNLINNSIQAMEAEGQKEGRIDVEVRFINKYFEILIEDDGPGIENENKERVFDFGYTTKKGGLGIGLFFVKKTIEENFKGAIEATSNKGKKTVMKISIPEYLNYIK